MDQLLVALDVDSPDRALALASELRDLTGGVKVGSRLFTLAGPDLVRELVETGHRVFLDLKFHDIPNTVAQAVDAAVRTGAWMINVHTSGGHDMMRAARDAGHKAATGGRSVPLLIGVTVLTSMTADVLQRSGVERPLTDQVLALARAAQEAGLDGVVASPQDTAAIRAACGAAFTIVTPGIRGASAGRDTHDQTRTMGPGDAVRAGATYIVVGRPIIAAPDPRAAAAGIARELASAAPVAPDKK
jgi:orotidine-5'-phosphate decarboxylase